MDQKNTIVKCNRSPKCLFEHNGVCDNYVINIGADGQCTCYVEAVRVDNFRISEIKEIAIYKPNSKEPLLILKEPQRGQRAKCNFYEDIMDIDDKHLGETATVKIPDSKDTDIHFTIQNAQWNEKFLRDQMCWYCDNGSNGNCKLTAKPSLDKSGKCPRYISTGGNR